MKSGSDANLAIYAPPTARRGGGPCSGGTRRRDDRSTAPACSSYSEMDEAESFPLCVKILSCESLRTGESDLGNGDVVCGVSYRPSRAGSYEGGNALCSMPSSKRPAFALPTRSTRTTRSPWKPWPPARFSHWPRGVSFLTISQRRQSGSHTSRS